MIPFQTPGDPPSVVAAPQHKTQVTRCLQAVILGAWHHLRLLGSLGDTAAKEIGLKLLKVVFFMGSQLVYLLE